MKYLAVIDTNVLVSAMIKPQSVPRQVLNLAFAGPIIPVLNDAIEKEYREVLSRPKFHLPADLIEDVVQTFRQKGLYVNAETLDVAFSDPKDVVFFEVVMETRKNEDAWLVTGNAKHFPTVPFVVTPRQMLDIILRDQEHLS